MYRIHRIGRVPYHISNRIFRHAGFKFRSETGRIASLLYELPVSSRVPTLPVWNSADC